MPLHSLHSLLLLSTKVYLRFGICSQWLGLCFFSDIYIKKSVDFCSSRDDLCISGQGILRNINSPIQVNTYLKDAIHELRKNNQKMGKQTAFCVYFCFVI